MKPQYFSGESGFASTKGSTFTPVPARFNFEEKFQNVERKNIYTGKKEIRLVLHLTTVKVM